MIYWHFRNFQCIICSLFRKKIQPTQTIIRRFFANPFDSDWGQFIQAGRYFTYTDAARWEIAGRMGFIGQSIRNKWIIIIGGQKIVYRKPIKIFKFFNLKMKILGWDEKWMYAVHIFEQSGHDCVVICTKIGLRKKGKLYSPISAFKKINIDQTSPPNWILNLFEEDLELISKIQNCLG